MIDKQVKHYSYDELKNLLKNKKQLVNTTQYKNTKSHINECNFCWNLWNRVRWDKASENKGTEDLKDFFGKCFIPYFDSSWALANQWYGLNPKTDENVKNFYKSTPYYIYNSFIFHKSGDRISKIDSLIEIIKKYNLNSILDYGCGIGLDGLEMISLGLDVHFTDYDSPSMKFLKYKLKKNGNKKLIKQVHNVEKIFDNPPKVDVIWSIDVLEHMLDPMKIFKVFTDQTKAFIFYIDSSEQNGGRHPFHFDVNYKKIENHLNKLGFKKEKHNTFQIWIKKN